MAPGDVIYVEASSGAVKRVGRCDAYATEFDLEADEYVPLPKVGLHICVEVGRVFLLHTHVSMYVRVCMDTVES